MRAAPDKEWNSRAWADYAKVVYAGFWMRVPADQIRASRAVLKMKALVWTMEALLMLGAATLALAAGGPKQPAPWLQLKLEALGFPGVSNAFLETGASMLTVHFIDDSHLLLTYSLRQLVPRVEGDPAGHDDREVAAEIIDLPGGKVAARTVWHLHDHQRYLWNLGHGSFLVRIGDRLYTMSPGARLGTKEVFERALFPNRSLRPTAINVSPDGGLVTIETVVETGLHAGDKRILLGDEEATGLDRAGTKTLIDFFRLSREKDGGMETKAAGEIQAPAPLFLPVDEDGLLWASPAENGLWLVNFDSYGGKTIPLGKLESSCQPRLQMLTRSEFVAMTCRGGDDRIKMASYGLDGKETWEESVGDFGAPTFAYAPASARFAVSHLTAAVAPVQAGQSGSPASQEVRVYQNASGDQLLRAECSPVVKSAENFDLSADGSIAVVVRNGSLVLYKLAPLSGRDREDIAEVEKFAPPAVSEGMVSLKRLTGPARTPIAVTPAKPTLGDAAASAAAQSALTAAPATTRRKPPTLLNPGEKPEFGTPNEQPPPES
jgi:hypothetical protein